jgi:hypothetical protein
MKQLLALMFISMTLAACDTQVKDFVDAVAPDVPTTPPISTAGTNAFKVSPGETTAVSANLRLKANVTPTQHKMTSAQLGMTVGISRLTRQ